MVGDNCVANFNWVNLNEENDEQLLKVEVRIWNVESECQPEEPLLCLKLLKFNKVHI